MAKSTIALIISIGLALVFIPMVVIGMAFMGGASWETVGQQVTIPILLIYILGIAMIFLHEYWR